MNYGIKTDTPEFARLVKLQSVCMEADDTARMLILAYAQGYAAAIKTATSESKKKKNKEN